MPESGRDCLVCAILPESGIHCLLCATFARRRLLPSPHALYVRFGSALEPFRTGPCFANNRSPPSGQLDLVGPLEARKLRDLGITEQVAGGDGPVRSKGCFTLVPGPRRSLSLKLGDTRVYEPQIRARLGTTACEAVVLKLLEQVAGGDKTVCA